MAGSAEIEPTPLRRSKRRSSAISPAQSTTALRFVENSSGMPQTPSRRRQKRVRFSEPTVPPSRGDATGLTPFIRHSSLSTPLRSVSSPIPLSGEYQFTPFRQVLRERCQRRIRRNGLSGEMNEYETECKDNAKLEKEVRKKDEELQRLRQELEASRRASTRNVNDEISSSQHIDEVEAELEELRQSFNAVDAPFEDDAMIIDWSEVHAGTTPGPRSDGGDTICIHEDDTATNFDMADNVQTEVELLGMALDLESAKQEKRRLFAEVRNQLPGVEMNFADSPARSQTVTSSLQSLPSPPKDFYHNLSKTLKATTHRAEEAELALHTLEAEIKGMGFVGEDAGASISEISKHFRTARLELERAIPGETTMGFENTKVIPEIIRKLKSLICQLGDREAELKSMRDQQKTIKGNFDHAIFAAEKTNNRIKELENTLDTGAEEMLEIRMRSQALERDNVDKDKTIASLIAALNKYREDVNRLEALVIRLESGSATAAAERDIANAEHDQQLSDLDARAAAEATGRRAAEESAINRLAQIQDLEKALATAQADGQKVDAQIHALQRSTIADSTAHAQQLGSLNSRISSLSTALASANAEVDKLKITKKKLEERIKVEVDQGQRAVETMQTEIEKGLIRLSEKRKGYVRGAKVRVANAEIEDDDFNSDGLETPMTPASLVRFVDVEAEEESVPGSVQVKRGKLKRSGGLGLGLSTGTSKGRRRYDSGIGMSPLSEDEESAEIDASTMTPELSSEGDYDVDVDLGLETA